MTDWSAAHYLKFEDERTRPARELLARVPVTAAREVVDLGCGPGNSTELLAARWPEARVTGVDTSADMLATARGRLPNARFVHMDVAAWTPGAAVDVIFANAVLHWVPDHARLLPRLFGALAPGGALAVQMPDNLDEPSHALMREVARRPRFRERLAAADGARQTLLSAEAVHDLLAPLGARLDQWTTVYRQVMAGPEAIVDWVGSTGLKPYVDPLPPEERAAYLADYRAEIARAYPERADGRVLFAFPRVFLVAVKAG